MTEKNDGGPAFPSEGIKTERGYTSAPGLSIRDYFAAAALTGMLASETTDSEGTYSDSGAAQRAYNLADALLAQREKEQ